MTPRAVAKSLAAALLCLWVLGANVSPDFTPIRSELASARGFSRGLVNLVVLAPDQSFRRAPSPLFVLVGLFVFSLLLKGRFGRYLPAAAIVFLAAVAVSPWVTPYRVVLAPRTFALCVLLVCSGPIVDVITWLGERWTPRLSGALAAAFFASMMWQALGAYSGNYSGFLHLSRDVADRAPFLQERPDLRRSLIVYDSGYDGQFMYLMAFDPFLRRFADRPQLYRSLIDDPPYRYGRIGFSLLANLASGGRPQRFPAAMMWLIVAAHFALATFLATFAVDHGRSPFAGLWYVAIPSFAASLMSALPEALAAAGLVGGFLCWQNRRLRLAAALFGAALLVRETGVILLVALVVAGGSRERKASLLMLAAALAPVCAWRGFVAWRLFADFGWAAIIANPHDLGVPFGGLIQLWRAGSSGIQPAPEIAGALLFPLILTAAFVLAVSLIVMRRGPLELAAAIYAAVAVSLNYGQIWSHLPSGERGAFETFVCLLLILLESKGRPVWIGRALTALFIVLVGYTFFIAVDAPTSRAALLLIR